MFKNVSINHRDRILIVDDEEFCITTMKHIFKSIGVDIDHTIDYCFTGKEAIEQVKDCYRLGLKYKLILTDFCMPELDGIQSTKLIRNHLTYDLLIERSEQPIIIGVTGHVLERYKIQGEEAGMDDVYPKPFYIESLKDINRKYKFI